MDNERLTQAAIDWINERTPSAKALTPDDILSIRFDSTVVSLVVDRGILGGPKYIIPLTELAQPHLGLNLQSDEDEAPPKPIATPAKRGGRKDK